MVIVIEDRAWMEMAHYRIF